MYKIEINLTFGGTHKTEFKRKADFPDWHDNEKAKRFIRDVTDLVDIYYKNKVKMTRRWGRIAKMIGKDTMDNITKHKKTASSSTPPQQNLPKNKQDIFNKYKIKEEK